MPRVQRKAPSSQEALKPQDSSSNTSLIEKIGSCIDRIMKMPCYLTTAISFSGTILSSITLNFSDSFKQCAKYTAYNAALNPTSERLWKEGNWKDFLPSLPNQGESYLHPSSYLPPLIKNFYAEMTQNVPDNFADATKQGMENFGHVLQSRQDGAAAFAKVHCSDASFYANTAATMLAIGAAAIGSKILYETALKPLATSLYHRFIQSKIV